MIKKRTILLAFLLLSTTGVAATKKTLQPGQFSYDGHVFLNATKSAVRGENYLLNEQLSNIKLATDWQIKSWLKWHGLVIYNTAPTPIMPTIFIEQAYLEANHPTKSGWFMVAGKKWLTFGNYKNDLIYKPLTKALGQTNNGAFEIGYDQHYYANATLAYPHSKVRTSSLPLYYNLNAGFRQSFYDVGASYLYSISDSQLFQYNKGFGGFLWNTIQSQVPGTALYGNFKYGRFNTYLTYVSALHPYYQNELSFQNKGAKPSAISVQHGYTFNIKHIPVKLIAVYDQSFQALALKLPRKRVGFAVNIYPHRFLDVQFEMFKDYNYSAGMTAVGLNKTIKGNGKVTNTYALQLVINF